MIQLQNVFKSYPSGQVALTDVSFYIGAKEMVFLAGHTGAGKTTLLKLMGLFETPTQGKIFFDGKEVAHLRAHQKWALQRRIGTVFQQPEWLADHTVFENVALPLVILGMNTSEIQTRVHTALEKVGLLDKKNHDPRQLSVGEQQCISIARAIVHTPALLLADEPTAHLDTKSTTEVFHVFDRLCQSGMTLVIASHDLTTVARMKRRLLILDKGSVIAN